MREGESSARDDWTSSDHGSVLMRRAMALDLLVLVADLVFALGVILLGCRDEIDEMN